MIFPLAQKKTMKIPTSINEYTEKYDNLWGAAHNSYSTQSRILKRYHKHFDLTEKNNRVLFLAPVGNQCFIDLHDTDIVIAGISTSQKAVKKFYDHLDSGQTFANAARNAVYDGKMKYNLYNMLITTNKSLLALCTDNTTKQILNEFKNCNSFDKYISIENQKMLFTQRIKDASLGFTESCTDKEYLFQNKYYHSSLATFLQSDFDPENSESKVFLKPFIDEIDIIYKHKNSKINTIVLLGRSCQYYADFLQWLNTRFNQVWSCKHPARYTIPEWKRIL